MKGIIIESMTGELKCIFMVQNGSPDTGNPKMYTNKLIRQYKSLWSAIKILLVFFWHHSHGLGLVDTDLK